MAMLRTVNVMAVVIAVVALYLLRLLLPGPIGTGGDPPRHRRAEVTIRLMATACRDFQLDNDRLPANLSELVENPGIETWDGPYLSPPKLPKDPWGRPYQYLLHPKEGVDFDIFTLGADDQPGGTGPDSDCHSMGRR